MLRKAVAVLSETSSVGSGLLTRKKARTTADSAAAAGDATAGRYPRMAHTSSIMMALWRRVFLLR